jgi:hypothetical protein
MLLPFWLSLFFLSGGQAGSKASPVGCLRPDGTVERLKGFELGSLKLTKLGNGKIRYGAVDFRQGICVQEIHISANRGTFLYGPAADPLLQGELTNLAISAENEGPSPTILNLKKSGFGATIRISKYRVPSLLSGTVVLPARRVWMENTDALSLRTRVDGAQDATGLFSFDTTEVRVTGVSLALNVPVLSWNANLQSVGAVRLSLDLAGQSLTLRRGSFLAPLPKITQPLSMKIPSLNVSMDHVTANRAMVQIDDDIQELHVNQFGAAVSGVMTIEPSATPVVIGGRWAASELIARRARSKEPAPTLEPLEVSELINSGFTSSAVSAQIIADGGGVWKELLAAVGWLNPEEQRRRAIDDTRKQLATQAAPAIFVFLKRTDVEKYVEGRLKELLQGVPIDLIFGKQELAVGLAKDAKPQVPLDFHMHQAPSVVESDLLLRPSISAAALGNYAVQNRASVATLWTALLSRLRNYIQHATSEPIRLPIPKLTEEAADLTKLKIEPPQKGPHYTIRVTGGDVHLGIKLSKAALIVSPDGLRLIAEVVR